MSKSNPLLTSNRCYPRGGQVVRPVFRWFKYTGICMMFNRIKLNENKQIQDSYTFILLNMSVFLTDLHLLPGKPIPHNY